MAMFDHLIFSARQPDCLLALLPYNNGCVINPLRQGFMYPVFNSSENGSWAQRHGLITPSNIANTESYFASADPTKRSHIVTPLDFQNNSSSKTFIVKACCPRSNAGVLRINPFFSQGNHSGNAKYFVVQFSLWENTTDTRLRGYISNNEGIGIGTNAIVDESVHSNWHVFAMVVEHNQAANMVYIRLYWNGVQIASRSSAFFSWNVMLLEPHIPDKVAVRLDTDVKYIANTKIAWALIFDRALPTEEIQLFK